MKTKESVKTSLDNIQPVVLPDIVEAVQEFLIKEAGELLDRLNGSLSALCYLSVVQSRLVGGGVRQPNISTKLATLVKQILSKAGEATEKVLCKRESRSGELLPILHQWFCLMKGDVYSPVCFKF